MMFIMKLCVLTTAVLTLIPARGLKANQGKALPVVPQPLEVQLEQGVFNLTGRSTVFFNTGLNPEAGYLAKRLRAGTGYPVTVKRLAGEDTGISSGNGIFLLLDASQDLGNEGYELAITPEQVVIKAKKPAGAFYGIQTLLQLLPAEIMSDKTVYGVRWVAPAVKIKDKPRFGWRAYLLDEARWFKGMETVKRMLDQMALFKMNVFHWHLTDDQGWRIEIKRYPRLTEIGSKRKDTQVGGWGSPERSGEPHQGFYTQEEIREIVQYAAERHITVIPEIEMPGHASAAIAAYPEVGTSGSEIEVQVTFGKKYDTFNVADENVYTFLENILEEVMLLFPSEVIHLGGDEVRFDHWLSSPRIKAMMEKENLSGPAQVQLFFTNRISWFLESKGRRMMGWNEILGDDLHGFIKEAGGKELKDETGGRSLAPNAVVHFWKGSLDLARLAVESGHEIVNSYHAGTYLDYTYQDIPLQMAYDFEPVPSGLAERYHPLVLGSGCQMWGEWIPTGELMEYQTFPRICAYAEVGWSAGERKDFENFIRRMRTQVQRWQVQNISHAPLMLEESGGKK
ncbi:beta-N-acetylhexosaminidase [Gemmatimonadota bacterium]